MLQESSSRRVILSLGAVALAATPKPAHALFGFGGGKSEAEIYQEDTVGCLINYDFAYTYVRRMYAYLLPGWVLSLKEMVLLDTD